MFGSGKEQFEKMVEKHQWDALARKLTNANAQTRADIAAACGKSNDDESMNILVSLLKDKDDAVMLQVVKSLGLTGRSGAKTHLQYLKDRVPEDKAELRQAIKESLALFGNRQ